MLCLKQSIKIWQIRYSRCITLFFAQMVNSTATYHPLRSFVFSFGIMKRSVLVVIHWAYWVEITIWILVCILRESTSLVVAYKWLQTYLSKLEKGKCFRIYGINWVESSYWQTVTRPHWRVIDVILSRFSGVACNLYIFMHITSTVEVPRILRCIAIVKNLLTKLKAVLNWTVTEHFISYVWGEYRIHQS